MPDLTTCLQTSHTEQAALLQALLPSLHNSIFLQDCGELSLLTILISPAVGMLWLGWDVCALGALHYGCITEFLVSSASLAQVFRLSGL